MPEPQVQAADLWSDVRGVLDNELSRLPDKYRAPVVLCDLEGRTRREVARQLKIPEGTLSGRLTTARRLLARRLRKQGISLSGGVLAALLAQQATAGVPAPVVSAAMGALVPAVAAEAGVGIVSPRVAVLTAGVLRTMFIRKLSRAAILLFICCVVGTAAAVLGTRTPAQTTTPTPEAAAVKGRSAPVAAPRPAPLAEKKKPRILLFCGGPSREYQFLRSVLTWQAARDHCELTICLQQGDTSNVKDSGNTRAVANFPEKLNSREPNDRYSTLDEYDVIITIDPDWSALKKAQHKLLQKWVKEHGGGLVFVAGPIHTLQLDRPREDLAYIKALYPVVFSDRAREDPGLNDHDSSRPYALAFTSAAQKFDFLKLDPAARSPLSGWDVFFWKVGKPDQGSQPERGFYTYCPVRKLQPGATLLASLIGSAASRNQGKDPFLVHLKHGKGTTLYIGSSETWRLRAWSQAYHEHFWMQLARHMATGRAEKK
jgi:hypothetical protein